MARKMHEKRPEEDNRYHDTWKLLKKYRDVTWSLEVSVRQVKNQFRIDYDCSIEDFLDSIYMAGADLGGTIIEDPAKCIERSYKMLTLLENAVNLLRTRHKNGEVYYWILYYSFLSPQKLKNVDEIIEVLRPHIRDISSSTYYRLRKEAELCALGIFITRYPKHLGIILSPQPFDLINIKGDFATLFEIAVAKCYNNYVKVRYYSKLQL